MRICIYTDVHFSEYSSILRSEGIKYSNRLEYLIKSLNWAESEALKNNCSRMICLGDFFDKPDLNSRELTAIKEINWNNLDHYFLVGNHEASSKSLVYNSVKALEQNNFKIISKVICEKSELCSFLYVPYLLDDDRLDLSDYRKNFNISETEDLIVFSHNDIKGIKYGFIESKNGFSISDIENNCRVFLNGHIHNGSQFCKNGFNLGNLSGQNFGEDAFNYDHGIFILDTDMNTLDKIENPFAFNFYKLNITSTDDFNLLSNLKDNAILSIRCNDELIESLKQKLSIYENILKYKLTRISDKKDIIVTSNELIDDLDHLKKFKDFCLSYIQSTSEILESELSIICKD